VHDSSGEARAIARAEAALGGPVTLRRLVGDLQKLAIPSGRPVLIHSSLSAIGWVAGGPSVVIDALIEALGPSTTIVVPCQSSDRSDPSHWRNPPVPAHWLPIIRDEMPAFDPRAVETRGMGRIVEAFRNHPLAVRGSHPTVSFAAIGPQADWIANPHPLAPQFGEGSPLARLYSANAIVLHLGTTFATNTAFHLAEHRAGWPNKPALRKDGAAIEVDGVRQWVTFDDEVADDEDFGEIGEEFALVGQLMNGTVGAASARWFSMVESVDFAVRLDGTSSRRSRTEFRGKLIAIHRFQSLAGGRLKRTRPVLIFAARSGLPFRCRRLHRASLMADVEHAAGFARAPRRLAPQGSARPGQ
jgi:aminoglycoside 3-N-acetyltransferase